MSLKKMWVSRNTKALDSFLPQKWEVHAISLASATSKNDVPMIGGKRIMDHTGSHASIT